MSNNMAKSMQSMNKLPHTGDDDDDVADQRSIEFKCRRRIANRQTDFRPRRISLWLPIVFCTLALAGNQLNRALCQGLPEDIQRELNQNLAEQARIQAMRARHQQQIQSRAAAGAPNHQASSPAGPAARPTSTASGQQQQPPHDPNNYSYQQVSPPIQYSYYQPYGDLAKPQQQQQQQQPSAPVAPEKPINIDLNNLNFDDLPNLPTPQAQTAAKRADVGPASYQAGQPQRLTPHFTGVGGLPIMQPVAAANQSPDTFAPAGQAPLAPQAQQGPPLTEADFKDITGGENYGAPGGSDFGLGAGAGNQNQANGGGGGGDNSGASDFGFAEPRGASSGGNSANSADNADDAQLREFGMPDSQMGAGGGASRSGQQQANPMQQMGLGDFGNFNPMAGGGGGGRRPAARQGAAGGFDPFAGGSGLPFGMGDMGGLGGAGAGAQRAARPAAASGEGDFDFASQPSSRSQGGDPAAAAGGGSTAPGSLQSLLGSAFPGLGGGNGGNMGLEQLAQGAGGGQSSDFPMDGASGGGGQQRQQAGGDDGVFDMADMGDRSDNFPGADLGGMGGGGGGGDQPNDQDYNEAAAAEQQPKTVPYPDGGPQFVGTLWALSQPQSLSQTRYNALPDKGTYQDYPAYQAGGNDFSAVRGLVDSTPRARPPGQDRYGAPAASQLAPEYQGQQMDYSQPPVSGASSAPLGNTGDSDNYAATNNDIDDEFF